MTDVMDPSTRGDQDSKSEANAPEEGDTGTVILSAQSLSLFYGEFRAVTDVTLDIRRNEITAIIGPSGCGKSTVLRTINRMNDLIEGAPRANSATTASISTTRGRSRRGAAPHRHGVPEAEPLPEVDLRQRRVRAPAQGTKRKSDLDGIVETSLKQAALWDEVQDAAQASRRWGFRAASSNGSASPAP